GGGALPGARAADRYPRHDRLQPALWRADRCRRWRLRRDHACLGPAAQGAIRWLGSLDTERRSPVAATPADSREAQVPALQRSDRLPAVRLRAVRADTARISPTARLSIRAQDKAGRR